MIATDDRPHIAFLPDQDLPLAEAIALMQKVIADAPTTTPLVVLAYSGPASDQETHDRRKRALGAVLQDATPSMAPDRRLIGICPGFPPLSEDITTAALTDAIALVTENEAITGQLLIVTPD